MKNCIIVSFIIFLLSATSLATVDANSRAYIVIQDVQSQAFFIERVPIIGCYGLAQGPQLAQFTAPYEVISSIGCGNLTAKENINSLSCATLVSAKESADFSSFKEVTLNISNCAAKNNLQFLKTIRIAAQKNFPQKAGVVKLILID